MNKWPVLFLLAAFPSVIHAATAYDDFSHPRWTVVRGGIGPWLNESNERLVLAFPAESRVGSGAIDNDFRVGYGSTCLLHGNFDISVRYALLKFPPGNGVRVGLTFGGRKVAVERTSFSSRDVLPTGERYVFHGDSIISTPTSDSSGTLRAVRENGVISGYYFDAASKSWQFIGSSSITTDDLPFWIEMWSHDWAFSDRFTKVALDHVLIRSGTLVGPKCPFVSEPVPAVTVSDGS